MHLDLHTKAGILSVFQRCYTFSGGFLKCACMFWE